MGYVLDQERLVHCEGDAAEAVGRTVIETSGISHAIQFVVDHVTNEPRVTHTIAPSSIASGTRLTIQWPVNLYGLVNGQIFEAEDRFKDLARSYAWFNPHLTLRGAWDGVDFVDVRTSNPHWTKWRPSDPTSPHWYTPARLQRYLSAHVARDRQLGQDRPVREFIVEFRGLSGTRKQKEILAEIGASRQSLRNFFGETRVNRAGIGKLLEAMKRRSAPVIPKHLGVIGRDHFKALILAAGGAPETFKYEIQTGFSGDIPYVVECAFGLHRRGLEGDSSGQRPQRLFVTGANWSVGINNPFRRFGRTGQGLESTLAAARANAGQPVIMAVHLASAHIQYADRGKSSIIVDGDVEAADV